MTHYCGNEENLQNQRGNSVSDYDGEGFEDRVHKSQGESDGFYGGEPENVSYTDTQGLIGGNDPAEGEGGYGSGEKRSSQYVGTEGGIPQSLKKWESEDIGGAAVEEEGSYGSGEKGSSQYVGTEGGIPQSLGKWKNENTGRDAVEEVEEGGYGSDEKRSSSDVGCGDGVPHSIEKGNGEYRKYSTDDVPYISAERLSSESDFGSKTSSHFTELRKPGGGYDNEDISYEPKKADDGVAGYVQSAQEPYAKEEMGGSGYVKGDEEPCGREEKRESGYLKQEEEGYKGVNEATYKSTTQEDSQEGLKEKVQEKLFLGGEDYEVDGSHEKKGFVEKIKEKLKGKPQGNAESKHEEEDDKVHDQEQEEYHEGEGEEGHKKGIFERIKEKLSPP